MRGAAWSFKATAIRGSAVYNISTMLKNKWIPRAPGMFTVAGGYRYRRIDRNDF